MKSAATRTIVSLVCALALAACGSSSSSSGADGTGGTGADTSIVQPDGGGSVGDVVGADGAAAEDVVVRPPGTECLRDDECGEGRYCDCRFKCQDQPPADQFCIEDANCGSGSFCEPCARVCREQLELCQPCLSENRCDLRTGVCEQTGAQCKSANPNSRSHCLDYVTGNSYCGQACINNYGCPPGYECVSIPGVDEGQCVLMTGDCASGRECEADDECPWGEICGIYGACAPGCQDDAVCGLGKVCNRFRCQEACHDLDNPCPPEQECDEGHCKIPGSCIDKYDCEEIETYCHPDTHMCTPGCLEDFDCKRAGYICEAGACEQMGCERNWYCAFGQVCDKETGDCEDAEGPYCEACNPDEENACGEGNECIGLQDKDGNDLGDFCFVQCQPTELDRCPQGYECMPLQDQNGSVQNEVCGRDCSKEPVGM